MVRSEAKKFNHTRVNLAISGELKLNESKYANVSTMPIATNQVRVNGIFNWCIYGEYAACVHPWYSELVLNYIVHLYRMLIRQSALGCSCNKSLVQMNQLENSHTLPLKSRNFDWEVAFTLRFRKQNHSFVPPKSKLLTWIIDFSELQLRIYLYN